MARVPLSNGAFALVDDIDYALAVQFRWYPHDNGYAIACQRDVDRVLYLHRLVMDAPDGVTVDHINGDRLDNRKGNLRFATQQQQMWNSKRRTDNTSGFKGVARNRARWGAYIRIDNARRWLGTFDTQIEAAQAYDEAAIQHFGEFARLNFPGSR